MSVDVEFGVERPTVTRGEANPYIDAVRKLAENRDETAALTAVHSGKIAKLGKDRDGNDRTEDKAVATLRRKLDEAGAYVGVTVRKHLAVGKSTVDGKKVDATRFTIWAVDKQVQNRQNSDADSDE